MPRLDGRQQLVDDADATLLRSSADMSPREPFTFDGDTRASYHDLKDDDYELASLNENERDVLVTPPREALSCWQRCWQSPVIQSLVIALVVILSVTNLVQLWHSAELTRQRPKAPKLSASGGAKLKDAPGKAVVLASFRDQNVSWAPSIPEDWRLYRYVLDDPSPFEHGTQEARIQATVTERVYNYTYTTPRNLGREAMAYLSFIVDHYDNLPHFILFLHGHDRSWHQIEHAANKMRALNLTAVAHDGYVNVRCNDERSCKEGASKNLKNSTDLHGKEMKVLPSFWKLVFPTGPPLPEDYQTAIYGQFAVPRTSILARPYDFWKGLQRTMERDPMEYYSVMPELKDAAKGDAKGEIPKASWVMGMMYEHIWHVLMGMPAKYCPGEEYCRKTVFSDAIHCNGVIVSPKNQTGWEDMECKVNEKNMEKAAQEQEKAVKAARKLVP